VIHSRDDPHDSANQQKDTSEHTGVGSETALEALIRRRRLSINPQPPSDGTQQHAQGASSSHGASSGKGDAWSLD
jgi:hypothetical protein